MQKISHKTHLNDISKENLKSDQEIQRWPSPSLCVIRNPIMLLETTYNQVSGGPLTYLNGIALNVMGIGRKVLWLTFISADFAEKHTFSDARANFTIDPNLI